MEIMDNAQVKNEKWFPFVLNLQNKQCLRNNELIFGHFESISHVEMIKAIVI